MDRFRGQGNPLDSFAAMAGMSRGAPQGMPQLPLMAGRPPSGGGLGGPNFRPLPPGMPSPIGQAPMPQPGQMGAAMPGGPPMMPSGQMMGGGQPGMGVMPQPMAPPPVMADPMLMQILMQHLMKTQQDQDEYAKGRAFMTQLLSSRLGR